MQWFRERFKVPPIGMRIVKSAAALVISGMIIVILYTTVLLRRKQASYFSCVVFLSIVVNHVRDADPYRNASKENMIHYLKDMLGVDKTVTFGSIPDRYDIIVESGDANRVVHILKKQYEPFGIRR